MAAERRLLSLRRRVPPARGASYGELWDALAAAVTADGAHAWRFVSPQDSELHLEFLEFKASDDPRNEEKVRELLDRLDTDTGASTIEEWLEDR